MQKSIGISLSLLLWSNVSEKPHTRCKHHKIWLREMQMLLTSPCPHSCPSIVPPDICVCATPLSNGHLRGGTGRDWKSSPHWLPAVLANKQTPDILLDHEMLEGKQTVCLTTILVEKLSSSIRPSHTSLMYNSRGLLEVTEASLDQKKHPDNKVSEASHRVTISPLS